MSLLKYLTNIYTQSTLILSITAVFFYINSQLPTELQIISYAIIPFIMLVISILFPDSVELKSRIFIRTFFIAYTFFLSIDYLYWRFEETLPTELGIFTLICGVLLFLAECHSIGHNGISYLINFRRTNRKPIPLPLDVEKLPIVDIYLPTYNEDPTIVFPSLIAATQLNYPSQKLNVYLLDDGGTKEKCNSTDEIEAKEAIKRATILKAMCLQIGAKYITREFNQNAKAGNINDNLHKTNGELLIVFDCDHIPTNDFLQKTVGFFLQDPKLFLVQTPHYFTNPDPLERNLSVSIDSPSENDFFHRVVQLGLDANGSSFFCGSAGVLRRSVLDEIGGISIKTIVEDAETTIDAFARGYKSAYLNEVLVSGLNPETFSGFIQQRIRWSQGMLQIFMLKNPWLMSRLTFSQRFIFSYFPIFWGYPITRLIMIMAPFVTLTLSIPIVNASVTEILIRSGSNLITAGIVSQYFYGHIRWPFISNLYEIIQSLHLSKGIAKVVANPSAPSFEVTPKGEVMMENSVSSLTRPFYIFLTLNFIAFIAAVIRFFNEPNNQSMILLVGAWCALDMLMLLCALGVTHEKKQRRMEPRARIEQSVKLTISEKISVQGVMINASMSGAKILFPCTFDDFSNLKHIRKIEVEIPEREIKIVCDIHSIIHKENSCLIGVAYHLNSTKEERIAVDIAFGSSEQIKKIIARRHKAQSHIQGLRNIIYYALHHGLGHLRFLTANLYKKITQLLNLKNRRINA